MSSQILPPRPHRSIKRPNAVPSTAGVGQSAREPQMKRIPPTAYADEQVKRHGRMLVYAYAFFAPLGTLSKIGSEHTSLGLSTACLALLILLRAPAVFHRILSHPVFFWLLLLMVYAGFSSYSLAFTIYTEEVVGAYRNLVTLVLYIVFAAAISTLDWTTVRLAMVARCLAAGMGISCALTLVDHFGVIDVPRVNEHTAVTTVGEVSVSQAHGPFNHRTSMAIYMAVSIPFFLLINNAGLGRPTRILLWGTILIASLVLLLSHNRAAPIAMALACGWFYVRNGLRVPIVVLKSLFVLIPLVIVVELFVPRVAEVYKMTIAASPLAFVVPHVAARTDASLMAVHDSDAMRLVLLREALRAVRENPFGTGFSHIYTMDYGWMDPHSIFTSLLVASGIFSIPWLLGFILRIYTTYRNAARLTSQRIALGAISTSLLALTLVALMHTAIYIGVAWMFLGLLISLESNAHRVLAEQFRRKHRLGTVRPRPARAALS